MPKESRHHCNNCNTSYSVTVGTIFHKTKVDLQIWFLALTLILNARKGISARQLARDLNVNRNTAWYMAMRIRKAMTDQGKLLRGIIEMDETFIGGKPRKGGNSGGTPLKRGRGTKKTPVVGMIERGGKVKAETFKNKPLSNKNLPSLVRRNIDISNASLYTDEYTGFIGMSRLIPHQTVDHKSWYVNGDVHTNSIEGFWALLKRGIVGQYHKVSLHQLPHYLDEFCYRHNNRNNGDIFHQTIIRAVGNYQ